MAAAVKLPAQTVQTLWTFNHNSTNGAFPFAGLTLGNDGTFYGTTYGGYSGSHGGLGTVFKVTTNGTLTKLVYFNGSNGEYPYAALTLGNDGNFYGTTSYGGSHNDGTVFKVTTDGTLTTLYSFTGGSDGAYPQAALTLGSDGNFYGTTEDGGSHNSGTVFCLLLPPPSLTLQLSAGCPLLHLSGMLSNNFVVQYSTNLANTNWINLLSLTNLSSSPCQFLDPAGVGQPARFYRAVQLQ